MSIDLLNGKPSDNITVTDVRNLKNMPNAIQNIQQREGKQGLPGKDGKTPRKGIDYFTRSDELRIIQAVRSLIPTPKDGETPIKGKDYFTDADISEFLGIVLSHIVQPQDGKDAIIDHDLIVEEVFKLIPVPKDGVDGKSIKGDRGEKGDSVRGEVGKDGKDAQIDTKELRDMAEKPVATHIEEHDHELLHDPAILGTIEVDETNLATGRHLEYNGEKLVYKTPKKGGVLRGGGASHIKYLSDVTLTDLTDNEILVFDTTTNQWINQLGGRFVDTLRITSDTTLTESDNNIFCDTDGGAFTVTLPTGRDGKYYRIINSGSSDLTITPDGSELLLGVNSSVTLTAGQVLIIVYESSGPDGWW